MSGRGNVPDGHDSGQELDHLLGMASRAVEEVETIAHLLDGDGVFLCVVLEDELLEVEEGALVRDFLADLHKSFPGILRRKPCAIWTLAVLDKVLDLERLFEDRVREYLRAASDSVYRVGVYHAPLSVS